MVQISWVEQNLNKLQKLEDALVEHMPTTVLKMSKICTIGKVVQNMQNCPAGVLRRRLLHRNGNFVPLAP